MECSAIAFNFCIHQSILKSIFSVPDVMMMRWWRQFCLIFSHVTVLIWQTFCNVLRLCASWVTSWVTAAYIPSPLLIFTCTQSNKNFMYTDYKSWSREVDSLPSVPKVKARYFDLATHYISKQKRPVKWEFLLWSEVFAAWFHHANPSHALP